MKDKIKNGVCKYCGGRAERTDDPIHLWKCRNCEEILLDDEVVEKDREGAMT